jgi:hypothetical protein
MRCADWIEVFPGLVSEPIFNSGLVTRIERDVSSWVFQKIPGSRLRDADAANSFAIDSINRSRERHRLKWRR